MTNAASRRTALVVVRPIRGAACRLSVDMGLSGIE
jgi:hypothetical protein